MAEKCECPAEAGAASCELAVEVREVQCPVCGQRGKPVDSLTVKAQLAVSLTSVHAAEYRFCRTPDCPVVYYAEDAENRFTEDDLRERVHQKHPFDAEVFVCYCFRHTPSSIEHELGETGGSTVVAAVTASIHAGQCACEIRNPQGSCCLGNVRAVVERLEAQVA